MLSLRVGISLSNSSNSERILVFLKHDCYIFLLHWNPVSKIINYY